jgi:hypothetical protein
MLSRLRFLLLLPLCALLACGSSSGGGSAANPTPTGDYVFQISPSGITPFNFTGALTVQGTGVTGVLRYNNPKSTCVASSQDIPFTGSIVNGVLTLTSGTFASSVATLTIPVPLSSTTGGFEIGAGTAVITGGSCAQASSSLQLTYIPSYGASWSGALTGPVNGTLSLQITESAANSDGQFPVTAAVTYTGAPCNFTLTGITGLVSGYTMNLGAGLTAPNSEISITASETTAPVTVSMNVFSGLNCPIGTYTGTIAQ